MRDIYRAIGAVLVVIVAALGIAAALHTFMSLPFDASSGNDKRAEWAAAFGTVGALIGTIWIATSERRQKARHAHDLAIIAAAGLFIRIDNLHRVVHNSVLHFLDHIENARPIEYGLQANLLKSFPTLADSEIIPLVPLPHRVALRLRMAISLADYAGTALLDAEQTCSYSWFEATKPKHDADLLAILIRSRYALGFCLEECRKVTQIAFE